MRRHEASDLHFMPVFARVRLWTMLAPCNDSTERSGLAWSWSPERTTPLDFFCFVFFPFSVLFSFCWFLPVSWLYELFCLSALPCSFSAGRGYKHAEMELYMSPSIFTTICTITWFEMCDIKNLSFSFTVNYTYRVSRTDFVQNVEKISFWIYEISSGENNGFIDIYTISHNFDISQFLKWVI